MKEIPVLIIERAKAQRNPRRVPKYTPRIMRLEESATVPKRTLTHSTASCDIFRSLFESQGIEGLYAMHTNMKNVLIGATVISNDILDKATDRLLKVTYREIFRYAISLNTSSNMFIRHTGEFSRIIRSFDIQIAGILKEVSALIGMHMLDYMVAGIGTDKRMHCVSLEEKMPGSISGGK